MTDPLLYVRDLRVRFPIRGALPWITTAEVRAVDGVDLNVCEGETLGIVGESGCGKTTLGSAILGLQGANSGEINFDGQKLSLGAHAGDRTGMQVIFQDPFSSLNPRRRIWKSVGEPLLVTGARRGKVRAKVSKIFETVGLQARHLDRLPHEFSGGQRQRLAIARALVLRPRLVVCDEPVSALDVSVQSQILNLLNQLQIDFGLTYIFISHDLGVVKNVSDRIAVMYLGQIVETASANRLFEAPAHPYTLALLNAIPRLSAGRRRERKIIKGELPSPTQIFTGCPFQARCPISTAVCGTTPPPVVDLLDGHSARCHHPNTDAVQPQML
jgi:oligopeptide/dipeptide ABC transporter ATP-binding protein